MSELSDGYQFQQAIVVILCNHSNFQAIIGTSAGVMSFGHLNKFQRNLYKNEINLTQENGLDNAVCKMAAILFRLASGRFLSTGTRSQSVV